MNKMFWAILPAWPKRRNPCRALFSVAGRIRPCFEGRASFKLHSQFIVEKKNILAPGSVASCLLPQWHSLGIAPFAVLPQRHAISCCCWSLQLHFFLHPRLPSSPPSPGPRISIKTWSAVAGRRKKAQGARIAFMKVFH